MRRSKAPSVLKMATTAGSNVFANISNDDNHVKALISTPVYKRPVGPLPASDEAQTEPSENCVVYTVVYGRQTTKKHKTFEHDGTLTIRNTKAILKDQDGKYVGSTGVKEQLESGQRLLIGSFECELIELQSNKRKSPPRVIQANTKRPRTSFQKPVTPVAETSEGPKETTTKLTKYNVVWARPTAKKHKTWEGDGLLEVIGQRATLKDDTGKVMGTGTIKTDSLDEGAQLFIDNKEVQIVGEVKTGCDHVVEPPKPKPAFRPVKKVTTPVATPEEPDLSLLLPEPPLEHQWHHNPTEAPITPVRVCHNLAKHLREHQQIGVRFIYECVMGFRNETPTDEHYGCILADEMGLGKTIQTLSVLYTLLKGGPYGKCIAKRILIVTPSSLMENWDHEITKWLHQERVFTFIADGKEKIRKFAQSPHIPILLISYEMFVKHSAELAAIRFDVLVCDEAHRLKNQSIKAATLLSQLECRRRILLTGTPIQNDLQEFYALINFANEGLLGTCAEFRQHYAQPIVRSQQPDCLPPGRERGEQRAKELNDLTARFVLRRTQEILQKFLPRKEEVVVFVRPSQLQQRLLTEALELYKAQVGLGGNFTALQMIIMLKKICNHPALLRKPGVKDKDTDEVTQALCWMLPEWNKMRETDSTKLSLVHAMLDEVIERGEKIVLVTYFTSTLTTLEGLCQSLNYKYCRLDGGTPASDRCKLVDTFNEPTSDVSVFLLSAKAGGMGLNLIGANRLILFDNDWNPSADLQAMSRIWRDGQQRPCYIYRLITAGTIEEKIFQRQMSKTSLSGCVVDLKQNLKSMKLSDAELKDLFSPANFDVCATHEMLQCGCLANGAIPERTNSESGGESVSQKRNFRFQIGKAKNKAKPALKMHELNKWEHHSGENLQEELLSALNLTAAREDIVFVFRSQNDKK